MRKLIHVFKSKSPNPLNWIKPVTKTPLDSVFNPFFCHATFHLWLIELPNRGKKLFIYYIIDFRPKIPNNWWLLIYSGWISMFRIGTLLLSNDKWFLRWNTLWFTQLWLHTFPIKFTTHFRMFNLPYRIQDSRLYLHQYQSDGFYFCITVHKHM